MTRSVGIDWSIGQETTFSFSYIGATNFTLDVLVISPSGARYASGGTNSHIIDYAKCMDIEIPDQAEVRLLNCSNVVNVETTCPSYLTLFNKTDT